MIGKYLNKEQKRLAFLEFLKNNPGMETRNIIKKGYGSLLYNTYKGRLCDAKRDAGIDEKYILQRKFRKEKDKQVEIISLLRYLINHPKTSIEDTIKAGHGYPLKNLYKCRLTDARKDAGIDEKEKTDKEKQGKKVVFLDYIRNNPEAKTKDIIKNGYFYILHYFYKGKISAAKKDSGINKKYIQKYDYINKTEEQKNNEGKSLLKYLKKYPYLTKTTIIRKHKQTLYRLYRGRINDAKKDAGVDERYLRQRKDRTEMQKNKERKALLKYLKENPCASKRDVEKDGYKYVLDNVYNRRINDAKREAGIDEKFIYFRKSQNTLERVVDIYLSK
jgi:hypothetical protein